MSESPTITIKIGTVEVSCTADASSDHLADVLRTLRREIPELVAANGPDTETAAALLERSEAKTFGEKAGVIAYWLEQHRGRRDWRSGDIVDALRDAGEPTPANITDTLNQKQRKGLFEVRDRRWRLTGEGRGWVKYRLLNDYGDDDD